MIQFVVGVLAGWLLSWAFEVWFWRFRRGEDGSSKSFAADTASLNRRGPGVKAGYIGADVLRASIAPAPTESAEETPARAAVHMPETDPVVPASPLASSSEALRLSEVLRLPRPRTVAAGSSARAYTAPALRLAESFPLAAPVQEVEPRSRVAAVATAEPEDDFTRINGIGAVYQKRLKLANVRSFRDLACTHPATLLAIIQPRHPNMVQVHQWIAEARALARPE